jgi:hypothetical protein
VHSGNCTVLSGTGQLKPGGGRCATDSRARAGCTSRITGPDFADASLQQANAWQTLSLYSPRRRCCSTQPHGHNYATLLHLLLVTHFPQLWSSARLESLALSFHSFQSCPHQSPRSSRAVLIVGHIPVPCRSGPYEPFRMFGPLLTPGAPCFLVARKLHLFPFRCPRGPAFRSFAMLFFS